MKQLEAVIFDADGTILNTHELIFESFKHILTTHGYPAPDLKTLAPFGGRPTTETYAHFAPEHDEKLLSEQHTQFQMEHLDLFKAYEGFEALMTGLKDAGLKIGICTNRKKNVLDLLKRIDIHHHFDGIVHADMMRAHKPDPDGIFLICKELGVDPAHAVMIGDNEADIGAGKAAGCAFTIGITHGTRSKEELEKFGADYIAEHLNDILPIIQKHHD